jgi:hypothetical protein
MDLTSVPYDELMEEVRRRREEQKALSRPRRLAAMQAKVEELKRELEAEGITVERKDK